MQGQSLAAVRLRGGRLQTIIQHHKAGLTWVMDDGMQRASHALGDGDDVWLIDPVDEGEAMAVEVIKNRRWKEVALRWRERDALVVAEAVSTAPLFALGRGAVGVHPVLRLTPPRALEGIDPGMLLVGHGAPVESGAAAGLREALARSRSDIPRLLLKIPGALRGRS